MRLKKPKRPNETVLEDLTLSDADHELIAAANAVLERYYKPFWHTVAAALRSRDGRIWTGIHIGATVGRLAIWIETFSTCCANSGGSESIASSTSCSKASASIIYYSRASLYASEA